MPKLYEYFGLIILFYANEHEPVHVHGKYHDRESRAEIIVVKVLSRKFDIRLSLDALSWKIARCAILKRLLPLAPQTLSPSGSISSCCTNL